MYNLEYLCYVFCPLHILTDDDTQVFCGVYRFQICLVERISELGRMTFLGDVHN